MTQEISMLLVEVEEVKKGYEERDIIDPKGSLKQCVVTNVSDTHNKEKDLEARPSAKEKWAV